MDDEHQNALHLVLSEKSNEESAELVVTAAISRDPMALNTRNNNGDTALHLAASRFYPSVVAALLEAGADANVKDEADLTPVYRLLATDAARGCLKAFLNHFNTSTA